MKKILQRDAPVLREIAKEVPKDSIASPKIKKVLEEMKTALASQDDGVAIAAPQIGYALRIFVVSKKVDAIIKKPQKAAAEDTKASKEKPKDTVFINPVIKKISKERKELEEGCLSVRYLYGKVSRGEKALVEAYDENGKKFSRGGTGLLAQIFQHEVDHLNGILFIDKAKDLEELEPPQTSGKTKN
jgi:peptide deformylase